MRVTHASEPAPDRAVNEDLAVTGPDFAIVLDGATAPPQLDSGCRHSVVWLVRQLAARLTPPLLTGSTAPLADLLAAAIEGTTRAHADTCDIANPDSPSSTATLVRLTGDTVDYLVLADSPFVARTRDGAVSVVVDDRVERLPEYTFESVRRLRNVPGGFWAASTRTQAAYEALAGSLDRDTLDVVALLSDGASRWSERHGHSWAETLEMLDRYGPAELIARVRAADSARSPARGKQHDDATAVHLTLAAPQATP